jgi:hypothetical protein
MRVALVAACALALAAGASLAAGLPESELQVFAGGKWVTWWASGRAPSSWPAPDPTVVGVIAWRPAAAGTEWAELELGGTGEAWRLQVVLARLDPSRLRMELVEASSEAGTLAEWSLDDLPGNAVLGVNAGQFTGGQPWGWLVRRGQVEQPPGPGRLSAAFAILADGRVRFVPLTEIPAPGSGPVVEAFQSYPVLLRGDGEVPQQLTQPGLGVDLAHRDARLAVGELRDGRIVLAITRFAAAGDALGSLPFGPTVPEMAAILGAIGCRQAMMLDGGISAQLALTDASGARKAWRGWRKVPLALVAYPR